MFNGGQYQAMTKERCCMIFFFCSVRFMTGNTGLWTILLVRQRRPPALLNIQRRQKTKATTKLTTAREEWWAEAEAAAVMWFLSWQRGNKQNQEHSKQQLEAESPWLRWWTGGCWMASPSTRCGVTTMKNRLPSRVRYSNQWFSTKKVRIYYLSNKNQTYRNLADISFKLIKLLNVVSLRKSVFEYFPY